MATEPHNLGIPRFGPSDRLINIFRAFSRDPSQALKERLKRMLNTFLQHNRDDAGNRKTKDLCCCEAEIWYYRILENLVNQKRKRLGITDSLDLLDNNLIQCCLVTCCLEIAICLNHLQCDFPLLLQIFNLAPYHFWRVIKLVQRSEVRLPYAVVRHLIQLEEKVLESLAWTSNSPLWKDISANEGHLPTCQQVIPPTQLEDPKRTQVKPDMNLPGVDVRSGADFLTSTEQQCSTSAVNGPLKRSFLHLFTHVVYGLMGKRLRELCSILDISDELRLKIWTCFEHSLVHCTCLMVDHHLDQLLMCAIYIMAKISKMEIPFKHIMKCYKAQPRANKSVCKNVLISGGDANNSPTEKHSNGEHGDGLLTPSTPSTHYLAPGQEQRGNLILFYNQAYTAKMQHFARQFAPSSGADSPPVSTCPPQLWKAAPRGCRLSSSRSIFISPYSPNATRPLTSGLCYYFSSSSSERLREINNMIKTGNKRSQVALLGKAGEAEDTSTSAKRPRLDDQSALQRRLRNVVSDRITIRNQKQSSPGGKLDQC